MSKFKLIENTNTKDNAKSNATAILLCTHIMNPFNKKKEKHILLLLNKNKNGYLFSTPGGMVDKEDKNNFNALKREYREEMGSKLPEGKYDYSDFEMMHCSKNSFK